MPCSEGTEENTVSELVIEDLAAGDGQELKAGDNVDMHYTGWLTDGTEFDSSHKRGRPLQFQVGVGRVIKGWDQGVLGMRVGGKRKLTIPSDMAYGDRGAGGLIPPGATLIFECELMTIR